MAPTATAVLQITGRLQSAGSARNLLVSTAGASDFLDGVSNRFRPDQPV